MQADPSHFPFIPLSLGGLTFSTRTNINPPHLTSSSPLFPPRKLHPELYSRSWYYRSSRFAGRRTISSLSRSGACASVKLKAPFDWGRDAHVESRWRLGYISQKAVTSHGTFFPASWVRCGVTTLCIDFLMPWPFFGLSWAMS